MERQNRKGGADSGGQWAGLGFGGCGSGRNSEECGE